MSTVKKDKKMNENTEIISGTTEDYDKQLNNFKSQNEIMKLGELRAQRQHEKEKISQIINKELDQDEITQQNILDFLDNFSTTKNKESKLLGLLFRVNVICKDFKKSKEIISKLNEQLSIVRRDLQLEKTTNMDLQDEIKEGIKELEDTEKEHKKLIQKSNESQQELNTKYDNILFWMKIYTYLLVYPSVFIILIFFSQIVPSYYT
jgi:hypothetical protein